MLKNDVTLQQLADDILGFLKSFIEEVMAVLANFEKHFTFEEKDYNKYPVEDTTNA